MAMQGDPRALRRGECRPTGAASGVLTDILLLTAQLPGKITQGFMSSKEKSHTDTQEGNIMKIIYRNILYSYFGLVS